MTNIDESAMLHINESFQLALKECFKIERWFRLICDELVSGNNVKVILELGEVDCYMSKVREKLTSIHKQFTSIMAKNHVDKLVAGKQNRVDQLLKMAEQDTRNLFLQHWVCDLNDTLWREFQDLVVSVLP